MSEWYGLSLNLFGWVVHLAWHPNYRALYEDRHDFAITWRFFGCILKARKASHAEAGQ